MNCLKQLIFSFFFFLACDKVTDVGIVIDSSSSVGRDGYENVKAFLVKLVDRFMFRLECHTLLSSTTITERIWTGTLTPLRPKIPSFSRQPS